MGFVRRSSLVSLLSSDEVASQFSERISLIKNDLEADDISTNSLTKHDNIHQQTNDHLRTSQSMLNISSFSLYRFGRFSLLLSISSSRIHRSLREWEGRERQEESGRERRKRRNASLLFLGIACVFSTASRSCCLLAVEKFLIHPSNQPMGDGLNLK